MFYYTNEYFKHKNTEIKIPISINNVINASTTYKNGIYEIEIYEGFLNKINNLIFEQKFIDLDIISLGCVS